MLAFALAAGEATACDSSSCALVTRGQGGLLAKRAFRIDVSYRYTDDAVLLDGSSPAERVYRPKVALETGRIWPAFHRELGGHDSFLQLDLAYGLASRTTLLASVPVLADRSYSIAHAGIQQDYGTRGFGDALFGVRQAIVGGLVGGLSVKLPSARHRIGGDFDGTILDPTLQPGSGSWDFVSGLQYAGHVAPWLVDWSLTGSYQVNTGNHLGRLPDQASLYGLLQLVPYRYVNETQLAPRAAFLVGVSKTF